MNIFRRGQCDKTAYEKFMKWIHKDKFLILNNFSFNCNESLSLSKFVLKNTLSNRDWLTGTLM